MKTKFKSFLSGFHLYMLVVIAFYAVEKIIMYTVVLPNDEASIQKLREFIFHSDVIIGLVLWGAMSILAGMVLFAKRTDDGNYDITLTKRVALVSIVAICIFGYLTYTIGWRTGLFGPYKVYEVLILMLSFVCSFFIYKYKPH